MTNGTRCHLQMMPDNVCIGPSVPFAQVDVPARTVRAGPPDQARAAAASGAESLPAGPA